MVVATFASVFAPLQYGMLPTTAAVDVPMPFHESVEPEIASGNEVLRF